LALVVIANPNPTSFTHAMAAAATRALVTAGCQVEVRDLYAEGFDPVLGPEEARTTGTEVERTLRNGDMLVSEHRRLLAAADILIVAHPNWWGKPPAMMAGWIDRVIVPGVAYRLATGDGEPECLLRLRRLLVLNTSDTPPEREARVFGDPLDIIWRRCIGTYLGDITIDRFVAGPMASSTPEARQAWLERVHDAAFGASPD
jgi:putative NADPH-quinone reductase